MFKRDWGACSNFVNYFRCGQLNWGGDLYDQLINPKLHFDNLIFIWAPKVMREVLHEQFGFANHLTLTACFISYMSP